MGKKREGGYLGATPATWSASVRPGMWNLRSQFQLNKDNSWPDPPAETGYQIERSLRFNSVDSPYLTRTPASASNRKTFTLSLWIKRCKLGVLQSFTSSVNDTIFLFNDSDQLCLYLGSGFVRVSTQVFRDVSAWYHFVLVIDTPNATAQNRVRMYVNNSEITAWTTSTTLTQNSDTTWNAAVEHQIGANATSQFTNQYIAEFYHIDGQALTPSSFGETDANGVWQPKAYTGTFGTNGFWLKFSDNSAATATTLGKDTSGNGNNWTPNNLSVTAGAGNDSLVDSPTNYGTDTGAGGEVRGNYATLNPLSQSSGTFSNGNLEYIGPAAWKAAASTILLPSSGKYFVEATLKAAPFGSNFGNVYAGFGVIAPSALSGWSFNSGTSFYVTDSGFYSNYNTGSSGSVGTFTSGTVVGLAINRDTNEVTIYQDGVSKATATLGITSGADLYVFNGSYDGNYGQMALNFGQRPFAYPVSGFKALCDTNLPAPVVAKPNTVMDVKTWSGNSTTQAISGLNFESDLIWIKNRSVGGRNHYLFDSVRGLFTSARLMSNTTDAESTSTQYLSAVSSTSFTLTAGDAGSNNSGETYVGWCWDAGSSTVTNTQGSITSQVRANASAGFSIVTFTGTSANATVGHGLGVAPSLIIVKVRTDSSSNWQVYHASLGNTQYISLNLTNSAATAVQAWNNTSPTSSVFSVGTAGSINAGSVVAYCFAPVAGYSSFGSYTGNGSTDGPFVYTGFRPRWVLFKNSSVGVEDWWLHDTARNTYNVMTSLLVPNSSNAEGTNVAHSVDALSNGFKIRTSAQGVNGSGHTIVYAAFAESPFQYARAR